MKKSVLAIVSFLFATMILTVATSQTQPPQQEPEIPLHLTLTEIRTIAAGLDELQAKRSNPILSKIEFQVNEYFAKMNTPKDSTIKEKPKAKKN